MPEGRVSGPDASVDFVLRRTSARSPTALPKKSFMRLPHQCLPDRRYGLLSHSRFPKPTIYEIHDRFLICQRQSKSEPNGSDQILDPRRQRLDVILRVGPAARNDDMDCLAEIPVQPVLVCHPDVAARIGVEGEGSITSAGLMRFGAFGPAGPMTLRSKAGGKPGREVDFARQTLITDVALAIALARAGAGVVGCLEPSVRGDLARGRLVEAFPGFGFPAVAMRIGVSRGHQTPAALLVATELARSLAGFLAPGE